MSSERWSSLLYCANKPNKELLLNKFTLRFKLTAELGVRGHSRLSIDVL